MKYSEFLDRIRQARGCGALSESAYAALDGISEDEFNSVESLFYPDYRDSIPDDYAEIDYGDRDDCEAYAGQRFDDMNYLRYRER